MHLVDHHVGTLGAQVGDDLSAVLLDLQREGVDDARDEFVHVDLRHVEVSLLVLVHAELQHLLHLEPQALRLVVDGRCQAAQHLGRLGHGVVVQHLRRQRDGRERRLELMRHVVDEVVLHLRKFLLAEDENHRDDERDEQDEREDDSRDGEGQRTVDVFSELGEVDLQHTHLLHRVVAEERLCERVLLALRVVVGALEHALPVVRMYGKVVLQVDAVCAELRLEQLVQFAEVDAVLQRTVARRVEDAVHHLID